MERTQNTDGFVESVDETLEELLDDERMMELGRRLSSGTPARPLLGVLPLARVVPQDIHSVMDYAGGLTLALAGLTAKSTSARVVGLVLGGKTIGASLLTDYRLSLAKVIPIEVHEVLDYVVGVSAIVAPFALGYYKRSRTTALTHIAVGASYLVASLLTDYRSATGRRRRATADVPAPPP